MRPSYPYPIPAECLDEFRHPAEWHGLHHAMIHAGEVLAGNGYVAIRAARGRWLDSDYRPATSEFLSRFGKLPWSRLEQAKTREEWVALEHSRAVIFAKARLGLWLNGKVAPSPVWRINAGFRCRLSHLQLVAMLPRVEVFCGWRDAEIPLFFRFSGGTGLIAVDRTLHRPNVLAARDILRPREDRFSRTLTPPTH